MPTPTSGTAVVATVGRLLALAVLVTATLIRGNGEHAANALAHARRVASSPVVTGFADTNGAHLYYEVYGEGEPLLLIPGATANHLFWANDAPTYAREFKVIVFDPRGTGQSSFPEGVELTTGLLADDAAALLHALGVGAAHVHGISMGGMVAQEMALRHPEKIRSLILAATTPGGPHSVSDEGGALEALFAVQAQGVAAANLPEGPLSPGDPAAQGSQAVEVLKPSPDYPQTPPEVAIAMKEAISGHDTYERLPSIVAPTLVLHGTDDPVFPAENARILAERVPRAELVLLEGARHDYRVEKEAEAMAAVMDFLRRHAGQAPAPATLPAAGGSGKGITTLLYHMQDSPSFPVC